MSSRLPILGELEHSIMEVVWRYGQVHVRDVVEALKSSRKSAYTTVMTVMNRLLSKGLLRRKPDGVSFVYAPTKTREQFLEQSSKQVITQFLQYFGDLAIAQFIDVLDDVDPQKIEALRRKLKHQP